MNFQASCVFKAGTPLIIPRSGLDLKMLMESVASLPHFPQTNSFNWLQRYFRY